MRLAALVFLLAAVFGATVLLGAVRLGSPQAPPPAIVLHGAVRNGVPAPPPSRTAVRQRVEDAPLTVFDTRRAHGGRP